MIRHVVPLVALLALGGCAFQTEAQINAELARHLGQSETSLVREMGVPTRSFESNGHRFLAYYKGSQQVDSLDGGFGGFGGFGGYGRGYGFGGFGGWGWGGGYGGFGGFGGTSEIYNYGCDTTFEVIGGRVAGFARHGNAC